MNEPRLRPAGAPVDLAATVDVSVIVPTRNEAGNVAALVARLDSALNGVGAAEIVFVDDSSDETPEAVRSAASTASRPVRLLHRPEHERVGGLGGAVLAGFRAARGEWLVVMDGDLQHPPERVTELVRTGISSGADLVVASRHLGPGSSAAGLSGVFRRTFSGAGTAAARVAFPRRLAGCTDPMSGFFALRSGAVDLGLLKPRGFKILLELVARSPRLRVAEVPFTFGPRQSGTSKASLSEGLLLLRGLVRLRLASAHPAGRPRTGRALGFASVGVTGIVVNSVALWLLVGVAGVGLLLGATLATQASSVWNFLLTDRLVFRGPKARSWPARLVGFLTVNNAVLLLRLPLLAWLVHTAGVGYLLASILTLVAAFGVRFLVSDRYLFRTGAPMTTFRETARPGRAPSPVEAPVPARTVGARRPVELVVDLRSRGQVPRPRSPRPELSYRYDVHGIVSIGSAVRLPELAAFRQTGPSTRPHDIEVRPGPVGTGRPRRRARVTQYADPAAVRYEEHLGRLGSDFSVEMGDPIQVVVGPMLVRSPHVLYTNVVEALLRFVMVARGHMLLHSACLELDGRGVLLSAVTDTGKTGTILRLAREAAIRFLSDDMTVLRPDGSALSFPKPLTISQHTLRAVGAGDLTRGEWRRLRVQSRLHSKEGRGIGTWLGELNVPIMTLNALTQYVVPPPKYEIERLVPCEHVATVQVEELFIIERGGHALGDVPSEDLVDELIANTDDAYGFPPFRYFAPALVVAGMGYEELRVEERRILATAMNGVRARRLATPDFTWADAIPALVQRAPVRPTDVRAPVDGGLRGPEVPSPRSSTPSSS